eukprot:CAMPEP_0174695670 /NCGR_PEP_ID=MMETSP1094-20130205/2006_1 /TAXON_ID=156173 /ORGANISM="Chrysochromulina brevifilum, Strain UTEX LB 985" /LENGTH=62 /DNA_ID=CAMNT_0015892235 /DNA_START=176 /DNA_END=360 /DNA_ORIENTATION=-
MTSSTAILSESGPRPAASCEWSVLLRGAKRQGPIRSMFLQIRSIHLLDRRSILGALTSLGAT